MKTNTPYFFVPIEKIEVEKLESENGYCVKYHNEYDGECMGIYSTANIYKYKDAMNSYLSAATHILLSSDEMIEMEIEVSQHAISLREAKNIVAKSLGYDAGILGTPWEFFEVSNHRKVIVINALEKAFQLVLNS